MVSKTQRRSGGIKDEEEGGGATFLIKSEGRVSAYLDVFTLWQRREDHIVLPWIGCSQKHLQHTFPIQQRITRRREAREQDQALS